MAKRPDTAVPAAPAQPPAKRDPLLADPLVVFLAVAKLPDGKFQVVEGSCPLSECRPFGHQQNSASRARAVLENELSNRAVKDLWAQGRAAVERSKQAASKGK